MIGAIAGDIIGSRWEGTGFKGRDFDLFAAGCRFTDDTVLTIAIADSILTGVDYASSLRKHYRLFPQAGYGARFADWARSDNPQPYGSWANGAAMRVSPLAWAHETLDDVVREARASARVTHDHPEGLRAAEATAAAVFLARRAMTKGEIQSALEERFGYELAIPLDQIRATYGFDVSAIGSVPHAIASFLRSRDWEDAVRIAISLGGDADTMASIAGAIAGAFYGMPTGIRQQTMEHLPPPLADVVLAFAVRFRLEQDPSVRSQRVERGAGVE